MITFKLSKIAHMLTELDEHISEESAFEVYGQAVEPCLTVGLVYPYKIGIPLRDQNARNRLAPFYVDSSEVMVYRRLKVAPEQYDPVLTIPKHMLDKLSATGKFRPCEYMELSFRNAQVMVIRVNRNTIGLI